MINLELLAAKSKRTKKQINKLIDDLNYYDLLEVNLYSQYMLCERKRDFDRTMDKITKGQKEN